MEIKEVIKNYDKESLFDIYQRIVNNTKDYNKITKEKMKESILKEYNNYNNIIEICTNKELKYLKQLLENNNQLKYNNKYEWEILTLENKLLIIYNDDNLTIPEDLYNNISLAIKNTNWKETTNKDKINEVMIGICKVLGQLPANTLIDITTKLLNINEEILNNHIKTNKLFNYYINYDNYKTPQVFTYTNYIHLIEKLNTTNKNNKPEKINILNIEDYISIFYNDFNLNNKIINKFNEELTKLNNYEFLKDMIILNILLNSDKEDIHILVNAMYSKSLDNIDEFIKLLDNALDEMPSAVLNGFTSKEIDK